jgi:hypothetical protein
VLFGVLKFAGWKKELYEAVSIDALHQTKIDFLNLQQIEGIGNTPSAG